MTISQIFEEIERQTPIGNSWLTISNGTFDQSASINTDSITIGGHQLDGNSFYNSKTGRVDIIRKIRTWYGLWKTKKESLSVEEFFEMTKKSKKKIIVIQDMVERYQKSIEQAEQFGQTALAEKLKDGIEVVKRETLAVVNGITDYLTQEQVERLQSKSSRNITIDFVKNFTRPIPAVLLKKKVMLDKDNVFSSYVIMHYDPKKKNSELTKKEKEAKRDPILFGVIKGSTNLYFIGDWVDEYCDLTLKEAVAIINESTKKL